MFDYSESSALSGVFWAVREKRSKLGVHANGSTGTIRSIPRYFDRVIRACISHREQSLLTDRDTTSVSYTVRIRHYVNANVIHCLIIRAAAAAVAIDSKYRVAYTTVGLTPLPPPISHVTKVLERKASSFPR